MPKIKSAAIKKSDGKVITKKPPARHKDVAAKDRKAGGTGTGERGFKLSDGTFAGRQKAKKVAKKSGQIKRSPKKRGLHSEDVW